MTHAIENILGKEDTILFIYQCFFSCTGQTVAFKLEGADLTLSPEAHFPEEFM